MREQCPKCAEKGKDTSRNGLVRRADKSAYCYKCRTNFPAGDIKEYKPMSSLTIEQVQTYPFGTDPSRLISTITAERYGVRYAASGETGLPYEIFYPTHDKRGEVIGYKVRRLPKDFRPSVGKIGTTLFGRQLATGVNKYLLLVEGEEDCLAAAQMLGGKKIDVMSVPNGASMSSAISGESDLFQKYERVYLYFDADEPGQKAMVEVADFLAPITEVRTISLEEDASYYCSNKLPSVFGKGIREATTYEPEGIINGCDIDLDDLIKPLPGGYPLPFAGLQEKLHGVRKAEILTVCAGSGIGKSTMVREIVKSLIEQGCSVANIALEDQMEDAAKHLIALDMNIPYASFKFSPPDKSVVQPHYDKMIAGGNTYFYKHFAGITANSLMNKLYYYARSKAVDFIVLDHLSMVISATETNNERKAIDTLMTNLAKMVVETGVGLIQIVHLRRTSGDKSYAHGGEVELTDLRGSAALEQLSWGVIGLERDQQGDSRDFSKARVLKNRTYGFTGLADSLKYNPETGRMASVTVDDEDKGDIIAEIKEDAE